MSETSLTLREWQQRCYDAAVVAGWETPGSPPPFTEMVSLLHSEVSEALESYRDREPLSWTRDNGKPEGIGAEFGDIFIRLCHYAQSLGVDLEYEVARKAAYNATRGYRHCNDERRKGQEALI